MKVNLLPIEVSAIAANIRFQPIVEDDDAIAKQWSDTARGILVKLAPHIVSKYAADTHFSEKDEEVVEVELTTVEAWFILAVVPYLYTMWQSFPGVGVHATLYEALLEEENGYKWVNVKVTKTAAANDKTFDQAYNEAKQRWLQKQDGHTELPPTQPGSATEYWDGE